MDEVRARIAARNTTTHNVNVRTGKLASGVTREIVAGVIVVALILAGLGLLVPVIAVLTVAGVCCFFFWLVARSNDRFRERIVEPTPDPAAADDVIREAHVLPDGRCSYCYALASVHVGGDGRLQDVTDFHGFANPRRTGGRNATGAIELAVSPPCSRCDKFTDRVHIVGREIVCTACVTRSDLT